jgi:hypothetical protein
MIQSFFSSMVASQSRMLFYFLVVAGFHLLQTSSRSTKLSQPVAQSPQLPRSCAPRKDNRVLETFTGGFMLRLRGGGGEHSKSVRSKPDTRKRLSSSSKSTVKPFRKRSKKWKRKKRSLHNEETIGEQNEESSTAHVFDRGQPEQEHAARIPAQASLTNNGANISIGGGALDSGNQV